MTDRKQLILGILLLAAAGLSSWLGLKNAISPSIRPAAPSTEPDIFMETIVVRRMDIEGNLINELRSPRLDHYTKSNTTHLITPSLILYSKKSDQPWHITALHGRAHQGSEWIDLWDKVTAHKPAGTQSAITFLTEAATLYPDKEYAVTDRPVKTTQGGLVVEGIGMQADLKKELIKILSHSKSSYVPNT